MTKAIGRAGFVDAYRAVIPTRSRRPGITWTFGYPFPRLDRGEAVDRIDMVHALRPAQVLAAGIVGPSGTPDADRSSIRIRPTTAAVFARVRLTPAAPRAVRLRAAPPGRPRRADRRALRAAARRAAATGSPSCAAATGRARR